MVLSVFTAEALQWSILVLFGLGFLFLAPLSRTAKEFFAASDKGGNTPGFWMLTSSLVISWIFAKSITNAANLGMEYGMVGGVAYGAYYLSFVVAGLVIYHMRTRGGFSSIHQFLQSRFGRSAVIVFSLLIGFRLFNEVWSNAMVIGSYFGAVGSQSYYWAILVFTGLTLAYVLKGGMRSSMLTDAIQMIFFAVLLIIVLSYILPQDGVEVSGLLQEGNWSLTGGVDLLLAACLQVLSYPFHDPVLTDRGFVSAPKTTLKSFLWAALIGFICIVLFSFVGVYAGMIGLEGQAAVQVAQRLGIVAMLVMNFIMITSAASTLDSAFSSFSKLIVIDLGFGKIKALDRGRWMMLCIAVLGTLPVFANPAILSATTVSGTMVMGLAPIFLLWNRPASALSFHLPIWFGVGVGLLLVFDMFPPSLVLTEGPYAKLLWANAWGLMGCFILYLVPTFIKQDAIALDSERTHA